MQAGAREFLVKPFSGEELAAALRRVNQLEKLKRAPAAPAAAEVAPPEAVEVVEKRSAGGRIILVFSGKGGIGKSLLAVNLAAALAKDSDGRTALV